MRQGLSVIAVVVVFAAVFLLLDAFYVVDETQQVVITQFGRPIGRPVTEAGLHIKKPLVQTANYFEKRILEWDGDPNQIPTLDKRLIWVDTMARWRIVDALKFMQTVGLNEKAAHTRLDDIIDGATRDAISNHMLVESVRNSNDLIQRLKDRDESTKHFDLEASEGGLEAIKVGREKITRQIIARSQDTIRTYGIELVDVRIKRINYVQKVQEKVFQRMISERKRAAEQFRSEGRGKKAEIEGQMQKELKQIRSEAYRKAQEITGKADAEATRIYAEAYNRDPEFYAFMRTLDAYRKTFRSSQHLILSTDSAFYQFLEEVKPASLSRPSGL